MTYNIKKGPQFNWYKNIHLADIGHYFGSIKSIAPYMTKVTQDLRFIIHHESPGNFTAMNNVCAHAGAPLLSEKNSVQIKKLVCPLHKWTYDFNGNLLHAPMIHDCKNIKLRQQNCGVWNGYVLNFSQEELTQGLATFGKEISEAKEEINIEQFDFVEVRNYPLPYPRLLMFINYFDGYHVPLYHQHSFALVCDYKSYQWELSAATSPIAYSIQRVSLRNDIEKKLQLMTEIHHQKEEFFGWAHLLIWCQEYLPELTERFLKSQSFALWSAVYGQGFLMMESYMGGLFLAVSYLVTEDQDQSGTKNINTVEYYLHKNIPQEFKPAAFQKFLYAYEQSAREDDEICLKLWEAHQQLKDPQARYIVEPLEEGNEHLYDWVVKTQDT